MRLPKPRLAECVKRESSSCTGGMRMPLPAARVPPPRRVSLSVGDSVGPGELAEEAHLGRVWRIEHVTSHSMKWSVRERARKAGSCATCQALVKPERGSVARA